jgi:RNA 2',3'-cyclic 3'-phosphodiesterase
MTREQREPSSRHFTAIPLDRATRDHVCSTISAAAVSMDGVRWVPVENLHVTLRFIGDCPEKTVPDILISMKKAARHLPADIEVGGIGGFPSQGAARVIWVGVTDPAGALEKVYNVLDKGASKCGFGRESRRYKAHITIGRCKKPARIPEDLVSSLSHARTQMVADRIVLYRSELTGSGAVYEEIDGAGTVSRGE